MNKREWEERVAALKKELADLEANPPKREPGKRWKPGRGEKYWIVDIDGAAENFTWRSDNFDGDAFNSFNVFETKEEAEFQAERTKVMRELDLWAVDYSPSMDGVCYSVSFSFQENRVYPCPNYSFIKSHTFETEEIAKKAIEAIGEERLKKYYFRVVDC